MKNRLDQRTIQDTDIRLEGCGKFSGSNEESEKCQNLDQEVDMCGPCEHHKRPEANSWRLEYHSFLYLSRWSQKSSLASLETRPGREVLCLSLSR